MKNSCSKKALRLEEKRRKTSRGMAKHKIVLWISAVKDSDEEFNVSLRAMVVLRKFLVVVLEGIPERPIAEASCLESSHRDAAERLVLEWRSVCEKEGFTLSASKRSFDWLAFGISGIFASLDLSPGSNIKPPAEAYKPSPFSL